MNWLSGLVLKTNLQYFLVGIGGIVTGYGWMDSAEWAQLSGALLVILPWIAGVIAAATEKVTAGGKTAKLADLSPATQNAIVREVAAK